MAARGGVPRCGLLVQALSHGGLFGAEVTATPHPSPSLTQGGCPNKLGRGEKTGHRIEWANTQVRPYKYRGAARCAPTESDVLPRFHLDRQIGREAGKVEADRAIARLD